MRWAHFLAPVMVFFMPLRFSQAQLYGLWGEDEYPCNRSTSELFVYADVEPLDHYTITITDVLASTIVVDHVDLTEYDVDTRHVGCHFVATTDGNEGIEEIFELYTTT
jgi:hypothetical protein